MATLSVPSLENCDTLFHGEQQADAAGANILPNDVTAGPGRRGRRKERLASYEGTVFKEIFDSIIGFLFVVYHVGMISVAVVYMFAPEYAFAVIASSCIGCIQLIFFHSWYMVGGFFNHFESAKTPIKIADIAVMYSFVISLISTMSLIIFFRFELAAIFKEIPFLISFAGVLIVLSIAIFLIGVIGAKKPYFSEPTFFG